MLITSCLVHWALPSQRLTPSRACCRLTPDFIHVDAEKRKEHLEMMKQYCWEGATAVSRGSLQVLALMWWLDGITWEVFLRRGNPAMDVFLMHSQIIPFVREFPHGDGTTVGHKVKSRTTTLPPAQAEMKTQDNTLFSPSFVYSLGWERQTTSFPDFLSSFTHPWISSLVFL